MIKGLITSALIALSLSAVSIADDDKAKNILVEAKELFAKRQAFTKNDPTLTNQIQQKLDVAMKEAQDMDLQYDILIFNSKVLYWEGNHTTEKEAAKTVFEKGYKTADAAKKLNVDYPEAYYFYAVNLARWAKKNGIVESLKRKGELMDNLAMTLERINRDGVMGEEIEFFGANRVLGKMYYELPGFAGGSSSKAIENLTTAYEKAPEHTLNVIYFAEALSKSDEAKACMILKDMLAKDPAKMIADRAQEATEDFVEAQELSKKLDCK